MNNLTYSNNIPNNINSTWQINNNNNSYNPYYESKDSFCQQNQYYPINLYYQNEYFKTTASSSTFKNELSPSCNTYYNNRQNNNYPPPMFNYRNNNNNNQQKYTEYKTYHKILSILNK